MPGGLTSPRTPVSRWVLRALLILVAAAVLGVLAGVVWEWIWSPPSGVAYEGRFVLDQNGLPSEFSGTGWYIVVAAVAGILLGVGAALVSRDGEVVSLVAVSVGAVLAGGLMFHVGHALGPPDPAVLAASAEDLTALRGDLRVGGVGGRPHFYTFDSAAFVAFPAGALLAFSALVLMLSPRRPTTD